MTCQRNWLYLESIFSAPDIQRQLPAEAKMFLTVDKSWKEVMRKVHRLPNALRAATQPGESCLTKVLHEIYKFICSAHSTSVASVISDSFTFLRGCFRFTGDISKQ